jgi:phosphatidylserine decarboxylase
MGNNNAQAATAAADNTNIDSITRSGPKQASPLLGRIFQQEHINFIVTNKLPRRLATLFFGWFSQIEQPLVRDVSIGIWKLIAGDLDLREAKKTQFASLHDCFVRELKPGSRQIDPAPGILVSPCDAIVGAGGRITGSELLQAKDSYYALDDLLGSRELASTFQDGCYVTLRLTSTMYHRFHAPYDGHVDEVTYISGDTWNVNPIALKRIERLFCKNERAVVPLRLEHSVQTIALVPVAAILVASIHFEFLDVALNLKYRGPHRIPCRASFRRGDELGHFRHGSTIIVLGTDGLELCPSIRPGERIRMGEPLFRHRAGGFDAAEASR